MLTVKDLTFGYGENTILDNFNAELQNGKIIAITGVSGVGKTTLLNLIAGLLPAPAGSIESDFTRPAYIFQDHRLFPWLSALDNVNIVCNDKNIASQTLSLLFEDESVAYKFPSELSGGMKQRISIARALAFDADVIFMDEPFKSLDEQTKKRTRDTLFGYIREKGISGIIVTHDPDDLPYCDSIIELGADGKILQQTQFE